VLLVAHGVEENRKIAADLLVTKREQIGRFGADHDPVAFYDRQAEQSIADRAPDLVFLH
jgi:hypothetical protein